MRNDDYEDNLDNLNQEDSFEDDFEDSPGFQAELSEQVRMVENSWNLLVERGYVPGQAVPLDFTFISQQRSKAQRLKAFLEQHEGYQVKLVNNDDEFEISGKTSPVELSLEMLETWVEKMVTFGKEYQCTFDGWTTEISSKRRPK